MYEEEKRKLKAAIQKHWDEAVDLENWSTSLGIPFVDYEEDPLIEIMANIDDDADEDEDENTVTCTECNIEIRDEEAMVAPVGLNLCVDCYRRWAAL